MFQLLPVIWCVLFSFLSFITMDYWLNTKPFFKEKLNESQHKIFVFGLYIIAALVFAPLIVFLIKKIIEGDQEAYFFISFYGILFSAFIFEFCNDKIKYKKS